MTLDELVAQTVRRHPDDIAVDFGDDQLTYAALWSASERVAGLLDGLCGASTRVGICAAGGPAAYVTYLAALRLGASVVPINPAAPPARNAEIARLAAVAVVVLTDDVSDETSNALGGSGATVLRWSALNVGREHSGTLPGGLAGSEAYLLFTSGTTGTPKGVPITHASAAAYVRHIVGRYRIERGSRLSRTFDLTFDPAVFDLFGTWAGGGTLVVPRGREAMTPTHYVTARRLTHWFSVPSVISLARRLRLLDPGVMPTLRYSVFIGEPLTIEQAAAWHTAAPDSVIENVYGPTELTVSCTEFRLPGDREDWPLTSNGTVPIGRLLPGLEMAIVDDELCVRGVQRFFGYLDAVDNAGRFYEGELPGPFQEAASAEPAPAHWYRTGDRVREENGALVHLGRTDRQVKLNGYRIELGEVEAAMRRIPGVEDAAALVNEQAAALTVFYTGRRTAVDRINACLAGWLPPYMLPSRVVWRQALPLNTNGKTDHKELAESAVHH
jgi:amino acid adenylation domain-containing protein